jgi:hypothetical protein
VGVSIGLALSTPVAEVDAMRTSMPSTRRRHAALVTGLALAASLAGAGDRVLTAAGQPLVHAAASATCDRTCLVGIARNYMDAVMRHEPARVPFAAQVKSTENGALIRPDRNVFSDTDHIDHPVQYVADIRDGEVGVMGVLQDWAGEALFALRLGVRDRRITEVETLVSHEGEGGVAFEPQGFLLREAPYIDTIPLPVRTPRDTLLRTAKGFWTVATTTHDEAAVAFSLDCVHIENGMNTDWEHPLLGEPFRAAAFAAQADGRHFKCGTDLATTTRPWSGLHDYHALVDPERGLVMVWNMVDFTGQRGGPFPSTTDVTLAAEQFAAANREQGFVRDDIPAGLSIRGMAAASPSHTNYNVDLERIIGGKITRQQVFVHVLPVGAQGHWAH